ncbi:hypothetical protein [Fodinicola feengrottensis]|uniref:hypothetical protein n=1 Tax=Fodinicola feengrottensis TaxID=435914 RepID=UPI0013D39AFA|nr:hypothetical protein [Fodinicola feengrottensis]
MLLERQAYERAVGFYSQSIDLAQARLTDAEGRGRAVALGHFHRGRAYHRWRDHLPESFADLSIAATFFQDSADRDNYAKILHEYGDALRHGQRAREAIAPLEMALSLFLAEKSLVSARRCCNPSLVRRKLWAITRPPRNISAECTPFSSSRRPNQAIVVPARGCVAGRRPHDRDDFVDGHGPQRRWDIAGHTGIGDQPRARDGVRGGAATYRPEGAVGGAMDDQRRQPQGSQFTAPVAGCLKRRRKSLDAGLVVTAFKAAPAELADHRLVLRIGLGSEDRVEILTCWA